MISRSGFLKLGGVALVASASRKLFAAVVRARLWGMAVDTARCARLPGCTKCIEACHTSHNVPVVPEPGHDVRWIWKEPFEQAFRSNSDQYGSVRNLPVMVLCNHCDNPPCVRVCPTEATWKREDGIVAMDWHRCIGCRYCIAACPYGARSFNWHDPRPYLRTQRPDYPTRTKGVVEKCTLCSERLAVGRPPACVEACPERALVFGDLADEHSAIRELLRSRYHIRRRPELGSGPNVFYIV